MALLAIDLGWILLWNARLHEAANAAAVAGAAHLPEDPDRALIDAGIAAGANRFPVPVRATLKANITPDNHYQVALDTEVDTFFLRLLGFDTFHLSQTADAASYGTAPPP